MKEDDKKEIHETFVSWINTDSQLSDNHLEDKIMVKILQEESPVVINRAAKRRLRNGLIAGYCISTFTMMIICLWNTPVFITIDLPPVDWQTVMIMPVVNYSVLIGVTVSLSLFFFLAHWWQSKKAMHHFN